MLPREAKNQFYLPEKARKSSRLVAPGSTLGPLAGDGRSRPSPLLCMPSAPEFSLTEL